MVGPRRERDAWDRKWIIWEDVPKPVQIAAVWAFLGSGPETAEDLARLRSGMEYGELGPIGLASYEDPRWMSRAVSSVLGKLSPDGKAKVAKQDEAIACLLGMKPATIRNLRTGNVARKDEASLGWMEGGAKLWRMTQTKDSAQQCVAWLPPEPAGWDKFLTWARSPNLTKHIGRWFPVDMGAWYIQKYLLPSENGLFRLGYRMARAMEPVKPDPFRWGPEGFPGDLGTVMFRRAHLASTPFSFSSEEFSALKTSFSGMTL